MSISLLFIIALLAALGLAAPAVAQDRAEVARQEAEVAERKVDVVLHIDGMTCPFCAYGVEKKLSELDEVAKVEVDLDEGRVLLTLREGRSLTDERLERAVDDAGFSLRKIERRDRDTE